MDETFYSLKDDQVRVQRPSMTIKKQFVKQSVTGFESQTNVIRGSNLMYEVSNFSTL